MAYQVIDSRFVAAHLEDVPLVDVRPHEMFVQGHVPHAINIPYSQIKLQTVGADGPAQSPEMAQLLAAKFREAGIFPYTEVMVMCQIGRTATYVCEMLSQLGYTALLLYKGSYQDWVSVPAHPIVTEPEAEANLSPSAADTSAPSASLDAQKSAAPEAHPAPAARCAPAFVAIAGAFVPTTDPPAPSSGPHPKAA